MLKKTTLILVLLAGCLFCSLDASAQITIQQENQTETREIPKKPNERFLSPEINNLHYRTEAMRRADRLNKRRERNDFDITVGLQATQTRFTNWAKGGDDTFNGLATLNLTHSYKKERLSYTTKLDARYGMSIIDTTTFKNEDQFTLHFQTDWSISQDWSLSGMAKLRSQFTKGYKSRKDHTLVSNFMAPGVFDVALGVTYNPEHWKITLSPITGSMLFVLDDSLSRKGINGIDPGKHFKPMVGPSLNIDYKRTFAKDMIQYRSNFYSFWNFRLDPNARWENWLDIFATKWLKTSFYWHIIYDKEANVPKVDENKYLQINYSTGIALTFTYKNKK